MVAYNILCGRAPDCLLNRTRAFVKNNFFVGLFEMVVRAENLFTFFFGKIISTHSIIIRCNSSACKPAHTKIHS